MEKVRLNDYVINCHQQYVTTLDIASAGIINPKIGEENEEYKDGLLELYQGKQQTETSEDVILGEGLENNQQLQLIELLDKFKDIFSDSPGNAVGMEHSVLLTTAEPVKSKPYGLPYRVRETRGERRTSMKC